MRDPDNDASGEVRPVSLATIAAAAGVSISTVSRIVNGETRRASAETVKRVRKAIEATGYRPNSIGRALRSGESRLVAMLVANLDNPAMATIAASTEAALRTAGYVMILCDTHDRAALQDEYLAAMRAQAVQGYVMVVARSSPGLAEMIGHGTPMVFVGRRNPLGGGAFVGIDNTGAGALVADYLWQAGIREPGILSPLEGSSSATRERMEGFRSRYAALGLDPARIPEWRAPGLAHVEIGYHAARLIGRRDAWPRGLLCVSDQLAYGAYRAARETGLHVPDDCRLVGIDGSTLNPWLAPWLASVRVPYDRFGPAILQQLQRIWSGTRPAEQLLTYGPVL
ncbi:LacI family transcriptional regulator [Roseomonas gilardii subsp. gilardii]|uniref:LacI family DNA-binding transcriptional regulator n=1 Tax=Roseomonas gilardii TaxID=257708 RepID=UPI001FFB182E|nr:LacI family DNA-binding transcriptional regulator [Roseomonas gilardii]UPG73063.1 LacI family transcriptional regulator [Roseomonas gilardii subsp. gilardii]